MSTLIILISIIALIAFSLVTSQLSYVNAQYLMKVNTTELNITNFTGAGTDNRDNSTTSNTQTTSGQGEDGNGRIASEPQPEPKCKGSALCPD